MPYVLLHFSYFHIYFRIVSILNSIFSISYSLTCRGEYLSTNLKLSIRSIFLKGLLFTPAHRSTSAVKKYTLLPYVWWCAPFLLPRDTHNMDHLFRGGPHIFDISLRLLVSNTVRKSKRLLRRSMNTIWSPKSSNATFWRRVTWKKMFRTANFA